ncbi:MAG: hypothetical protein ACLQVJ_27885 [Syntrophobacteraceae bacterium]
MKLRTVMLTGSVIVVVIAVSVWMLFHEHILSFYQEVLVSSGMTLTTQWLEVKPEKPMKTVSFRSELFIEVFGLPFDHDKAGLFLLADGARFEVEGYLTTDKGERIYLDKVSLRGSPDERYLDLSSKVLLWKTRNYRFRSLTLRSSRVLTTGRAVWISFDPLTTKDGSAFPDLLRGAPKGGGKP